MGNATMPAPSGQGPPKPDIKVGPLSRTFGPTTVSKPCFKVDSPPINTTVNSVTITLHVHPTERNVKNSVVQPNIFYNLFNFITYTNILKLSKLCKARPYYELNLGLGVNPVFHYLELINI